jgi:hypothetical protein
MIQCRWLRVELHVMTNKLLVEVMDKRPTVITNDMNMNATDVHEQGSDNSTSADDDVDSDDNSVQQQHDDEDRVLAGHTFRLPADTVLSSMIVFGDCAGRCICAH